MKGYNRHSRARMFESDFFEFFSKGSPAIPFIFYIPIAVGVLGYALVNGVTTLAASAVMLPLGWATWQVLEYFIHGYIFHWEGNGPFTRRMHEIVHGYHHKYPDDERRLVMPLGASLMMAVPVGLLLSLFKAPTITVPYWVGMLCGYLWYDFVHWSTHFRKPLTEWGRRMRSAHMAHHFADHTVNMGISHMWVDKLLGTAKVKKGPDADVDA